MIAPYTPVFFRNSSAYVAARDSERGTLEHVRIPSPVARYLTIPAATETVRDVLARIGAVDEYNQLGETSPVVYSKLYDQGPSRTYCGGEVIGELVAVTPYGARFAYISRDGLTGQARVTIPA